MISLYGDNDVTQIVIALIICVFSMCLFKESGPFLSDEDDMLAYYSQVAIFVTLFGALLMFIDFEDEGHSPNMIGGVMVAINVSTMLLPAGQMLMAKSVAEWIAEGKEKYDAFREVATWQNFSYAMAVVYRRLCCRKAAPGDDEEEPEKEKHKPVLALSAALQDALRKADESGDGELDFDEFMECLKVNNQKIKKPEARRIFNAVDADGGGTVDVAELEAAILNDQIADATHVEHHHRESSAKTFKFSDGIGGSEYKEQAQAKRVKETVARLDALIVSLKQTRNVRRSSLGLKTDDSGGMEGIEMAPAVEFAVKNRDDNYDDDDIPQYFDTPHDDKANDDEVPPYNEVVFLPSESWRRGEAAGLHVCLG